MSRFNQPLSETKCFICCQALPLCSACQTEDASPLDVAIVGVPLDIRDWGNRTGTL